MQYIGDDYDPRNDEDKEYVNPQRFKNNRRSVISKANRRGSTIRPETIKKYNIKKVNGKYV